MINWKLIWNTAWRDSRKNRGRLLLFMSSIIFGVAALVAINGFNQNLADEIDREALKLLGADLAVTGNKAAEADLLAALDSLPGEKALEMETLSMVLLPDGEATTLVRLKITEGDFPFYGEMELQPPSANRQMHSERLALIDRALVEEHSVVTGDSIKLGSFSFMVGGIVESAPGGIALASAIAPTVYISSSFADSTGLIQEGSLVSYAYYYKLPSGFDIDAWKEQRRPLLRADNMRFETVEDRKENLNQAFSYVNFFLNLVALVALLLGCIGVASSVWIYVDSKKKAVALLRCIGFRRSQAFMVYFLQIFVIGILGVLIGVSMGIILQRAIPILLQDVLPVQVVISVDYVSVAQAFFMSMCLVMLFALIPLLSLRRMSALQAIRNGADTADKRDYLAWSIWAVILFSLLIFIKILSGSWMLSLAFTGAIVVSCLVLLGFARLLVWMTGKMASNIRNFNIRQGLRGLNRPGNQSNTIMLTIGMGTAILTTLAVVQSLLLNNIAILNSGEQPNMILYGIESNQKDALREMTEDFDLPVIEEVPIVTMKIDGWKGKSKAEWLADTTMDASRWAINREARVSYRDTLTDDEKLIKGQLIPHKNIGDSIFVSLASTFSNAMKVDIGDEIVFNVQGVRMTTYVGSIREIDFRNFSTRFLILFPSGVLESAPQFHVLVTRTPDAQTMSRYRTAVVKAFPNVTAADLSSVLKSVGVIVNKITFVIRFMAIFSLLTGFLVLISSLLLSKYQRMRESTLLRTIGATRRQINMVGLTEFLVLGVLAAATGVLLAVAASYLIATQALDLSFSVDLMSVGLMYLAVVFLTLLVSRINHREVLNTPVLQVLRKVEE
jgi:putative ABC transport system permease protein